jgi:cystathionine gamma-synthase
MSAPENRHSIDTLAVQAASTPQQGEATPAVPPITPSVGYVHPEMADSDRALGYPGGTPFDPDRYVYARYGGPTQAALEEAAATLEGAEAAVSFSSGMSALHAGLLALVPAGGRIVAAEQLYGVTRTLLNWMRERMGLDVHFADFLDLDAAREAIDTTRPDAVICEVLTNPLVRVVEVDAIAEAAQAAGSRLLVDNTFATPLLLRPLEVGADAVVHSTTKFLNGHGDVLGGVIAGSSWDMRQAYELRKLLGAMPSAFDAWLVLRGMRTLAVRMRQQCDNAAKLAAWLADREDIARVYYPGLPGDAGHEAAQRLFGGDYYGSVLAFEVKGLDRAGAFRFVERLKLIRRVTSLGDVFSIVLHPASASHRALTPEQRAEQGITEGVLRLSVGIEGADDLMADIEQALGS